MTIPTLPDEITTAVSEKEAAERLGRHLGLNGPAPLGATKRACNDALYARALHSLRNIPNMRDQVLAEASEFTTSEATRAPAAKLIGKATKTVLKWGMDGLKPSEPWVIEQRLAACNACDQQVPAPETLMYRGAKVVVGKDAKICTSCNCLTNTKAAIPSEKCPEQSLTNPELSRWGDPWVPVESHPEGPW